MDKLGDLSDEELLARLRGHVGKGNVWCAKLIAYLVEVDERRLDRVHACSSMWDFCTRKLGMSEGEAHRRIAAARIVRRFPQVLGYIERGEVHLCALYALRKHLTSDNVDELLRDASGKSTREVERIVAARLPRPDIPTCIESVAPQALLSSVSPVPVGTLLPVPIVATPSNAAPAWALSLAASPAPGPRPTVEPLSATRYRIELAVSAGTKEMIDRIKDLMRHRNPSGDLETILDASLALLLAKLEKERGKTSRPGGSRRKPAEATNAYASAGSAHAELTTRSPTAPVCVQTTADDPAAHLRSETMTHATDGLARLEATAGNAAAQMWSEARMRNPHGLAGVDSTMGEPSIRVRLHARTQAPGALVHADATNGNQGVAAPGPASAEPSTAERAASTPATKASRPGSRYVAAEVRREVFARDGEQCTYVGPDGDRCPARGYLELDHVHPKARGGTETSANLRVRCRAHNALYAEQVFGRAHVAGHVYFRHHKRTPETPASFETAARGLRSLGFREPVARRALETLATKRDLLGAPVESILREALLVLT